MDSYYKQYAYGQPLSGKASWTSSNLFKMRCVYATFEVMLNLDAQYFGYNRPEINNLNDEGKESKELNEGE